MVFTRYLLLCIVIITFISCNSDEEKLYRTKSDHLMYSEIYKETQAFKSNRLEKPITHVYSHSTFNMLFKLDTLPYQEMKFDEIVKEVDSLAKRKWELKEVIDKKERVELWKKLLHKDYKYATEVDIYAFSEKFELNGEQIRDALTYSILHNIIRNDTVIDKREVMFGINYVFWKYSLSEKL